MTDSTELEFRVFSEMLELATGRIDLNRGDNVLYVPRHANGNIKHPSCEHGEVVGSNERYVFVRYLHDKHAKATDPIDLVLIGD